MVDHKIANNKIPTVCKGKQCDGYCMLTMYTCSEHMGASIKLPCCLAGGQSRSMLASVFNLFNQRAKKFYIVLFTEHGNKNGKLQSILSFAYKLVCFAPPTHEAIIRTLKLPALSYLKLNVYPCKWRKF